MAFAENFGNIASILKRETLAEGAKKSPPVEPENQWMVDIMKGAENSTWRWIKNRKLPDKLIKEYFYTLSGKEVKMDEYSFMVAYYKNQIKVIDTKITQCEARKARFKEQCDIEIKKYEDAIEDIEEYIDKRQKEYSQMLVESEKIEKEYRALQEEYDQGLRRGLFVPSDIEAKELQTRIDIALGKKANLPNHDEYIYKCKVINVRLGDNIPRIYPDVRLLIVEYEKYIDHYEEQIDKNDDKEDDIIDPLEERKKANEEELEKALEMYDWYYDRTES